MERLCVRDVSDTDRDNLSRRFKRFDEERYDKSNLEKFQYFIYQKDSCDSKKPNHDKYCQRFTSWSDIKSVALIPICYNNNTDAIYGIFKLYSNKNYHFTDTKKVFARLAVEKISNLVIRKKYDYFISQIVLPLKKLSSRYGVFFVTGKVGKICVQLNTFIMNAAISYYSGSSPMQTALLTLLFSNSHISSLFP